MFRGVFFFILILLLTPIMSLNMIYTTIYDKYSRFSSYINTEIKYTTFTNWASGISTRGVINKKETA